MVKSLVLYGIETWRWTEKDKSRLNAMEVLRRRNVWNIKKGPNDQ